MNKKICLPGIFTLLFLFLFIACEETEGIDKYANWQGRNEAFIDSIANVAKNNSSEWAIIPSYTFNGNNAPVDSAIYVRKINSADSGDYALYTDSVQVNYRGKLINGTVFGQSYTIEEPDPDFVTPVGFWASKVLAGFSTALQYMRVGDRWEIYIPWKLAYGSSANGDIPAYSALYYDLELVEIIPPSASGK